MKKMLFLLLVLPLLARAEYVLDLDRIHEVGSSLAGELLPPEMREQYEMPSPDQWRSFWGQIESALGSYELVDLAWAKPEAEAALKLMQSFPVAEPYAAWLLQRLDYLDMAHQVLRSHTNQPEPLRPDPPPPHKPPLAPPAPKPPITVSPQDNQAMQRTARSPVNWERKLAGRAPPARADGMVPGLKSIFEKEGIPGELVWLAEVESSFNPAARSPVGALGLFQFMPATAERFGMALKPRDERLDPDKNARAAAQYLRFLYSRFHSWPLALAAYNAGEGRVGRLLRAHNGTSFDDIAPHLPSETQMYVPKVMATIKLREGINPDTLRPPA